MQCRRASIRRRGWLQRQPGGLLLLGGLWLLGCQSQPEEKRWPVYPATGKVFWRGKPAPQARVMLFADDPEFAATGIHPYGVADATGTFQLTTYQTGDGAPPGTYRAIVVWPDPDYQPKTPDEIENLRMGGEAPDKLKGKYQNPTQPPATFTITETAGQELPTVQLD